MVSDPRENKTLIDPKLLKAIVEYGPIIVFFVTYWMTDLYTATAAIIIATLAVLALSLLIERRVPIMPIVTGCIIVVFGGLTLWLKDETFIKMKPTIIQIIFGLVLLGGLYTKNIFLQKLLGSSLKMEEKGWIHLTRRFSIFFFFMAILNELIWRTQSTDFWVNFKVFGILILTIVFLVAQMQLLKKYMKLS
ncbi:MAG: intracellular septation protein A [Gammaproteobacteria bacterium]|nr:intracellular septation protein A [Gammaproteobacteria bacterium]